jgi:HNH endonuclease
LPSAFHPIPFQIDHIIARQHGGATTTENLALACIRCNRFKGPNIVSIDPETGAIVRLFHPRLDLWTEHFIWNSCELQALTRVGRATISLPLINNPDVVAVRRTLHEEGVFGN